MSEPLREAPVFIHGRVLLNFAQALTLCVAVTRYLMKLASLEGDTMPSGIGRAPFTWYYYDQEYTMEFLGGFVGVSQEDTGALRPAQGWGVCEAK